jgi:hypothetical protein
VPRRPRADEGGIQPPPRNALCTVTEVTEPPRGPCTKINFGVGGALHEAYIQEVITNGDSFYIGGSDSMEEIILRNTGIVSTKQEYNI